MEALPLLYHPATALFVDSNGGFLQSLALHLDQRKRAYALCSHPMDALAMLREHDAVETLINHLWVNRTRQFGCSSPLQAHKQQNMGQELYRTCRFGNFFAVVLEHEMPALSGLQLCKRVENPFVQKILLTSCADEELLEKALQQGLVQAIVFKHDPCVLQRLAEALRRAQDRYFALVAAACAATLGLGRAETAFLEDRALRDFFAQLCQRLNIVEHHPLQGFTPTSSGHVSSDQNALNASASHTHAEHLGQQAAVRGGGDFVLLDREGGPYGLCVRTKEQIDIIAESPQWAQASPEVREDIRKRRTMLCVPSSLQQSPSGGPLQSAQPWAETLWGKKQRDLVPAQVVHGRDETYYCACARGLFGLPQERMAGFASYPDKLNFHDHVVALQESRLLG